MTAQAVTTRVSRADRSIDVIAMALVVYAAMNLNGVIQMLTGIQAGLSPLVLAASLVVIVATIGNDLLGATYVWFVGFMAIYLIGGTMPLVMGGTLDISHLNQYAGTTIYCTAIYSYVARRRESAMPALIATLKVQFLIDCVAALTLHGPSPLFKYARSTERATGFFDNPNETAVMALYYAVLCVSAPARSRLWTGLQVSLAVVTVVMTFSKTGFIVGVLLGTCWLLSRRAYGTLLLAAAVMVAVLPAMDAVSSTSMFDLTVDQRRRIGQIAHIFSGEVDKGLTTGRTTLWALGLDRIAVHFPFGAGLGAFHRMEGGFSDGEGQFLGVHNAFLMVLGESGLIALAALVGFLSSLLRGLLASRRALMGAGCFLVLVSDMMVSHGVLIIREHDLMLALMMAIAATGRRVEPTAATPSRQIIAPGRPN